MQNNYNIASLVLCAALVLATAQSGAGASITPTKTKPLWSSEPGSFAGIFASSLGLNRSTLQQLYGPEALNHAKTWVKDKKVLWCGTAESPDSEPTDGIFPFTAAPTNSTNWPGACPSSGKAQALFDKGLAWRMLFNDNEATCAFRAAGRQDKSCAMAHLGAALSMGPNVNYAFIISPYIYKEILQALVSARTALATTAQQLPLAPTLFKALTQRYCVSSPGQLDTALKQNPEAAFASYNKQFKQCGAKFTAAVSQLADQYPEDPNIAALAAGALMEQPAWKWWNVGAQTAGALANVALSVMEVTSADDGGNGNAAKTAIGLTSQLIKPHGALANEILSRGLNTDPNHLGLLHYMIHNLEQAPDGAQWSQAVADRLFTLGGASQGHAAHMRTHIDMRAGDYGRVITGNKRAIADDADWNIARSGGGIMSILYKYNPHNIAFIAEAAQHAYRLQDMSAAIAMLSYGAGLPLVADPSMGSLVSYHTRQLLQPLRFGMYQAILDGTAPGGGCPIQGVGSSTTLTVKLPGGTSETVLCGQTCSDARLFARTVSFARLGKAKKAQEELALLVNTACKDTTVTAAKLPDCKAAVVTGTKTGLGPAPAGRKLLVMAAGSTHNNTSNVILAAESVARVYLGSMTSSQSNTLGLSSTKASGTLTINDGDALSALNLLVPAAEVAGVTGQTDVQLRLLRLAEQTQAQMQYDEPAPFFYPVGETLAGVLLKRGGVQELKEAADVLRKVLYQWPRSALASVALVETLNRSSGAAQAESTVKQILETATRLNDTVIDLTWL